MPPTLKKKAEGAYCFGLVRPTVRTKIKLRFLNFIDRFSIKITDPYFLSLDYPPLLSYAPYKRVIMKFCNQDI